MRSTFSKKGTEGMSFNAIIGGVLAFISIAALTFIIFTFIGLFGKSTQNIDSTIHNYKELVSTVQKMVDDRTESINIQRFPLYVSSGYSIIGYDRFQNYVLENNNKKFFKPSLCKNKACICLYSIVSYEELKKDDGVLECTTFNKPVKFFSKGRDYERKHPDTFGFERNDITFPSAPRNTEYFIIHGEVSRELAGVINVLKSIWGIKNIELKKTIEEKEIFFEISAIPDAEQLRKEMTIEAAATLLDNFLTTPVPQEINGLILHPIEGPVVAKDFLENHPEVYQNKNYEEFLQALYDTSGGYEKSSVFMSVSYSMFIDNIPHDAYGNSVGGSIFIDYPPLTQEGITNDYFVDLDFVGVTPIELVVSKTIMVGDNQNATVSFFITDIGDFAERYRPDSSDTGASWK